jgi:hypothetical protein
VRPVRVGHAPIRAAPRPTRVPAPWCRWGAPELSHHPPLYSLSPPPAILLAPCSLWRRGAPWPPGGAPGWRCCCPSSPLLHIRLALLCLWSELTTEVKLLQPPETPCCRSCGPARTRTWAAAPDPPQAVLLAPVGAPGSLEVAVALHCRRAAPSLPEIRSLAFSSVLFATRDLGFKFEKTQGSRCESKTHMNSVCGLWRDSWKIQGSRSKSVFLYLFFMQISG